MSTPASTPARPATALDWEVRYREGTTGWDLGGPPPVLLDLLARLGTPQGRRVLVPGAGYGHDALAFARAGFSVTAVDIAPSACAGMRARAERAGLPLEVLEADVFALPTRLHGVHDLVWEQTCLCALPPERRADYVAALRSVLKPTGTLYALLWNHGQPGGPPYDIAPDLARALFSGAFHERSCLSVPPVAKMRAPEFLLELQPA